MQVRPRGYRFINREEGYVSYRLSQLGVRVFRDAAQLAALYRGEWTTIGPRRPLPIALPQNTVELTVCEADPLRLTAYQFDEECPGTDLKEVLSGETSVEQILREPSTE